MLTLEKPASSFQKHQVCKMRPAHHECVSDGAQGDPSPPAMPPEATMPEAPQARQVLSYEQEAPQARKVLP